MEKWNIYSIFNLTFKVILNIPRVYVQIDQTKCNLKCMFCLRDDGVNFDRELIIFKAIIDQ